MTVQCGKRWWRSWLLLWRNILAGPASYLAAHLQNDGEKQNFVNWLWKSFPERDDVCYHHSADIPWVAEQQLAQTPPVAIHIACFGWEDGCGMKPPPGKDLTLQLVEWYLKDGFISSGEVLLVSQPQALAASSLTAPWTGDLKPCSVGYIKGRARMTALLAILHVIYSDETGMDLTPCQKFMESVNLIWGTTPQAGYQGRRSPVQPENELAR